MCGINSNYKTYYILEPSNTSPVRPETIFALLCLIVANIVTVLGFSHSNIWKCKGKSWNDYFEGSKTSLSAYSFIC